LAGGDDPVRHDVVAVLFLEDFDAAVALDRDMDAVLPRIDRKGLGAEIPDAGRAG